jgi:hypothetical protein
MEVKDKKGRVVLHINRKGKLALSRYPDLSEEEIGAIAEIYCELNSEAKTQNIIDFLRFEEENEKFCS